MSRLQIKANAKRKLSLNLMPVILLWALPLVLMAWIQSQTYASIAMSNDMITFNVPTQFISISICVIELIVVFTSIQTLKYSRSQDVKDTSYSELWSAITGNDAFDYIKIFLWESLFIVLWALIPIVGWIIIFNRVYAYRMAYYLYHDYKFDHAKDAITESVKLMEGQKWRLFVQDLSFFWWYCLVSVTFGLASFYVTPYVKLAEVEFYDSLKVK